MEQKNQNVDQEQQKKADEFIKKYGELVKEYGMDFVQYPVFAPDGSGGFKVVLQNQLMLSETTDESFVKEDK